ncbi:MAG TPA: carboxymuconolactone decarboxylase family protein [Nevskiaceae bacterium]
MSRIDYGSVAPEGRASLLKPYQYVEGCGLEASLLSLVKVRASQINGCAHCIEMHTKAARDHGETEERLYLLDAWRESPCYTARERAALEWTEAVTDISSTSTSDALYRDVRKEFTEKEMVDLTLAAAAINSMNRVAIAFRLDLKHAGGAQKAA